MIILEVDRVLNTPSKVLLKIRSKKKKRKPSDSLNLKLTGYVLLRVLAIDCIWRSKKNSPFWESNQQI